METWQILIVTVLSAIVLGCIVGVVLGKHQLKKMSGNYKPILSVKERVVYTSCILLGAACILFGVFFKFPAANNPESQQNSFPGDVYPDKGDNPGVEAFAGTVDIDEAQADGGDGMNEETQDGEDGGDPVDDDSGDGETQSTENEAADTPSPKPAAKGGGGGVVVVEGGNRAVMIR